ncbi:MAG: METTL5 family protein [Candidatus Thalassarchaeaceae archaeon]|nr:hypothetical protein [Euryarchaeota archaeon]OUW79429.1 MAG: hypothetical protein CBD75_01090 [Euryarchaeota archaeon TMED215]
MSGRHNYLGAPPHLMRLRKLAMSLSKLGVKEDLVASLEQYVTPGDLASRWLFDIQSFGDLTPGCRVVDLGAGNGILGIGAVMMGAGFVKLVEADQELCELADVNAESVLRDDEYEVSNRRLGKDHLELGGYDLIISNPPWGRQKEGADADFFEHILVSNTLTHIMHSANAKHIEKRFEDMNWKAEKYGEADFPLPASYSHHKMSRGVTRAGFWRLVPP